jgi:hypothetical protein
MRIPVLYYLCLLIQIITALVGGFRYRNLPRPVRILEWLMIVSVIDSGLKWLLISFHVHTLWTSHFYTLIELICIVSMYSLWMEQHGKKMILKLCLFVFIFLWIVSKFSFEPLSIADDGTAAVSKVFQIVFSAYLLLLIVKENTLVWTNDPRFWIVTSTIIYAAGSLFWYALFNKMLEISPDLLKQSYSLNWILLIVSNLLYVRGFLCKK